MASSVPSNLSLLEAHSLNESYLADLPHQELVQMVLLLARKLNQRARESELPSLTVSSQLEAENLNQFNQENEGWKVQQKKAKKSKNKSKTAKEIQEEIQTLEQPIEEEIQDAPQTAPVPLTWADRVRQSPQDEKLRLLLRQPLPEDKKSVGVFKTMIRLDLSKRAMERPYFSWKTILKAFTGVMPLQISMRNLTLAEVFWDSKDKETVERELTSRKVIVETKQPTEKDLPRLVKAYLGGFFTLLRRATLEGLPPEIQASLLTRADEKVQLYEKAQDRKLWIKNVKADLKWLHGTSPLEEPSTSQPPSLVFG
jgi:hypothetical protein